MKSQVQPSTFENFSTSSGLHILSNFSSPQTNRLSTNAAFRTHINSIIDDLGLSKVGEAYHDFPGGGFTAVICLAESHLSIHTWPDQHYATFDVYLSNHTRDNRPYAEALYQAVLIFYDAMVQSENKILR